MKHRVLLSVGFVLALVLFVGGFTVYDHGHGDGVRAGRLAAVREYVVTLDCLQAPTPRFQPTPTRLEPDDGALRKAAIACAAVIGKEDIKPWPLAVELWQMADDDALEKKSISMIEWRSRRYLRSQQAAVLFTIAPLDGNEP